MERLTYWNEEYGCWSYHCASGDAAKRLAAYEDAEEQGRVKIMPVKQYQTVHYILDDRIYIGWYLAQVAEHTHLILQDKIEMGICWTTDGFWFATAEQAEAALERSRR